MVAYSITLSIYTVVLWLILYRTSNWRCGMFEIDEISLRFRSHFAWRVLPSKPNQNVQFNPAHSCDSNSIVLLSSILFEYSRGNWVELTLVKLKVAYKRYEIYWIVSNYTREQQFWGLFGISILVQTLKTLKDQKRR